MIAKAEEFARVIDEASQVVTDMGLIADAAGAQASNALGSIAEAAARADASVRAAAGAVRDIGSTSAFSAAAERNLADASADLMMQTALLASMEEKLAVIQRDTADSSADLMMQTQMMRESYALLDDQLIRTMGTLAALAATQRVTAGSRGPAGGAPAGGGLWGLTANQLHWIVMGSLEILSTAVPAMVALGAAMIAMYPAAAGLYDHFTNLVTAAGGLHNAMMDMGGPVGTLAAGMGRLSLAVQPDVWMILGSAISIATMHTGVFAGMAQQASNVLGTFATKVVADLQGPAGAALAGFFTSAVKYMIQWGQFLGNLGHTFLNAVNSMHGVGQLLLDVLVGISRALEIITSSPVGAFIIGWAAAMSAAYRYGQLLVNVFRWLGGSALVAAIKGIAGYTGALISLASEEGVAAAASLALGDALTAASGPLGIAIAAIAAGLSIWYLASRQASDSTTQLITRVEKAPPTVNNLSEGILTLGGALQTATRQQDAFHAAMRTGWRGAAVAVNATTPDVQRLEAAMKKLYGELVQQEQGLAAMGQSSGQAAASMNVLSVQTELQDSKVAQLNQAWDAYMSLVTGGEGGLAGFATSLANIGTVAGTTANNLGTQTGNMTLSVQQFAAQMKSGAVTGAGAWTNFTQVLGSTMPQLADWLQTAETAGAITKGQFAQGILDMAAQLVPYTGNQAAANAELLAFAQRSGLPIASLPQLTKETGGTSAAMRNLSGIMNTATVNMSNAGQIAQNMSSVFNNQVTQAISAAALKASGFQTAINNMITAQERNKTVGGLTWQQWLQQAQADLQQAQKSASTAAANITKSLAGIPPKTTVSVDVAVTGSGAYLITGYAAPGGKGAVTGQGYTGTSGGGVPTISKAHGGLIGGVGTGTSDSNLARVSRGEYIMQEAAVAHYGKSMMDRINARSYASGGIVGPGHALMPSVLEASVTGGGNTSMHLHNSTSVTLDGRKILEHQRTRQLNYVRRNPAANWNLRVR